MACFLKKGLGGREDGIDDSVKRYPAVYTPIMHTVMITNTLLDKSCHINIDLHAQHPITTACRRACAYAPSEENTCSAIRTPRNAHT